MTVSMASAVLAVHRHMQHSAAPSVHCAGYEYQYVAHSSTSPAAAEAAATRGQHQQQQQHTAPAAAPAPFGMAFHTGDGSGSTPADSAHCGARHPSPEVDQQHAASPFVAADQSSASGVSGLFGPPPGLARIAVTVNSTPASSNSQHRPAVATDCELMVCDSPSPTLRLGGPAFSEDVQLDAVIEREIEDTVGEALLGGGCSLF